MVRMSKRARRNLIVLWPGVLAFLFLALPAAAQMELSPAAAVADSSAVSVPDSPKVAPDGQLAVPSERLFYALPNFLTVESSGKTQPLTTAKKFELVARNTFDPVKFPWYGLQAGVRQAHDSQPEYGQGAAGYGKRYALTFADCTVENFVAGALLPSLLRQDPRYFREGRGRPNRKRIGYAMSRIFWTRGDSGRKEFNFSEIAGSALAAGISNYGYHPASDHNLQNVATGWGTQMAFHTFTILMREFWPDFRMKISGWGKGKT
jgi:hypothetical protein